MTCQPMLRKMTGSEIKDPKRPWCDTCYRNYAEYYIDWPGCAFCGGAECGDSPWAEPICDECGRDTGYETAPDKVADCSNCDTPWCPSGTCDPTPLPAGDFLKTYHRLHPHMGDQYEGEP